MSDTVAPIETATGSGAGALLRQAREDAGLHVAALAGALKVPQRQIEALEQDRIDQLPDVVYARALAASICRNLRIDPQSVLSRLPKAADSRLGKDEPINVPFRASSDARSGGWRDLLGRPPVMGALALLVGAVVLLLLPLIPNRTDDTALPPGTDAATAPIAAPVPTAPTGLMADPAGAPVAAVPAIVPLVPTPQSPSVPASTSTSTSSPASPAQVVEFRATNPAWVQVTDGRGTVHLRRTLAAGETAGVSAATPLTVVVGNANTVQVQVRGQGFDLAPHVRDNVARFEVR
ncbi:helix-turn-helix domain-containing protein [Ramlibacter sp. AW1]|uniref:Helix-turn-helix domain-containing protein n=1 Tax=Ramlibacter aurantiacus TaxID=2801330 RepID=A0A936ZLK4_9BURK|nr:helix-turn-helix domain-containing protein [Ramlibacter aurantiacus]MBL0422042.1 helix-turn-helix domain-containing protein [Ramlibacter aurantiacus]